ncbi:MAG: hypothetical protein SNH55_02590 [Rikenellaceae bacterium]
MKRVGKIFILLGKCLFWITTLLLLYFVSTRVRQSNAELKVTSLNIHIADSTSRGNLVSTQMVHDILKREKITTIGADVADLPLTRIERVIRQNGFIESVRVYCNAAGALHIDIEQRSAIARILLNGYNSYITSSGFVFQAPAYSSLYTSVITGDYRPFFPTNFAGNIDDYMLEQMEKIDLEIEALEREKYPILRREIANNEDKRSVRKRYINRSIFEDKDEFAKQVKELREENRVLRELYAYRQRVIDDELAAIDRRIEQQRERQKKLQKNCDDIHNLITFVEIVENDDFWRSEVVQITLSTGIESSLRLSMTVRSANFDVVFGCLRNEINWVEATKKESDNMQLLLKQDEQEESKIGGMSHIIPNSFNTRSVQQSHIEKERRKDKQEVSEAIWAKFNRLRDFYDEALPRVGWDRYKEINIEFEKQVVCKR